MPSISAQVTALVAQVGLINLQINNSNTIPQSVSVNPAVATLLGQASQSLVAFFGKTYAAKQEEWTAANTGEAFDLWEARQILIRDEISSAALARINTLGEVVAEINALLADACAPVFVSND